MTTVVSDLNKCKIFLLYRGLLVFEDSRWCTVAEYTEHRRLYSQLDRYYKKVEKEPTTKAHKLTGICNAIPSDSDSETSANIMPSNNNGSSDSSSSEQSADETSASEKNIMPAKPSNEQSSEETEKNIMPQEENPNGNDVDMDLEQIMEDSTAQKSSSSSSSSHSSSSSESETSSEVTSFICSTATCGEVFESAAGLRAHEWKHSGKRSKDGRIHCDYPWCIKHYGTKRALQHHKKNVHDNPGKLYYCVERSAKGKNCIKYYPTQQQLDQHVRGMHGQGFVSYCGKKFKWPTNRHKHQQECRKCQRSIA